MLKTLQALKFLFVGPMILALLVVINWMTTPGEWWVHARHDLPFQELYWNIPITVERGDPLPVQLTEATAQMRPKL